MSGFEIYKKLYQNIKTVIKGQDNTIRYLLAGFASGGHILIEDTPGNGKTTLAKALAFSAGADFKRIQFTPDLLPSDVSGVSIFDPSKKEFKLHKGPVFTNILLADEINRASPRTQSALLEAMAESQVSIDGNRMPLDDLFFVIATQNPVESRGTYPLPEAQMDRFSMKLSLGYVSPEEEVSILTDQEKKNPVDHLNACVTKEEILRLKDETNKIYISEELKHYIVQLVRQTRTFKGVSLGAGHRASLMLMKASKAFALFHKNEFVIPEYIQELAEYIIPHRMVLDPEFLYSGHTPEGIVRDIITQTTVPA